MIPKNNFKSLHRKYYCLKFTIFKLQVKESVLCGCYCKTHSDGAERQGRQPPAEPWPGSGTSVTGALQPPEDTGLRPSAGGRGGTWGVSRPRMREHSGLILRG